MAETLETWKRDPRTQKQTAYMLHPEAVAVTSGLRVHAGLSVVIFFIGGYVFNFRVHPAPKETWLQELRINIAWLEHHGTRLADYTGASHQHSILSEWNHL